MNPMYQEPIRQLEYHNELLPPSGFSMESWITGDPIYLGPLDECRKAIGGIAGYTVRLFAAFDTPCETFPTGAQPQAAFTPANGGSVRGQMHPEYCASGWPWPAPP